MNIPYEIMKVEPDINFETKKHIFSHLPYEIMVSIVEVNWERDWELMCWPNHATKIKRALLLKFTKSLMKTTLIYIEILKERI